MLVDRHIRTAKSATGEPSQKTGLPVGTETYDNYSSRLIKLIPAEVIAFYLALDGIASAMPQKNLLLWVAFGIALTGGWFYLGRLANVTRVTQRLLTMFALVIWVYVFGGPFTSLSWYDVNYGKFVLVVFTFFVPVLFKVGTRDK
jgi:hypothetical protein